MVVSIHQPNFFPYEGVIDKIRRSDVFVVLCQAQFSPGNYHNRFGLDGRWFTMGTDSALTRLCEKRYSRPAEDWAKIKRRLTRHAEIAAKFDDLIGPHLARTNTAIAERICAMLGIRTTVAADWETPLRGTDRLVDICRKFGATTYLSGQSGPSYLEMDKFERAGIGVEVQDSSALRRAALDVLAEGL